MRRRDRGRHRVGRDGETCDDVRRDAGAGGAHGEAGGLREGWSGKEREGWPGGEREGWPGGEREGWVDGVREGGCEQMGSRNGHRAAA